MRTTTSYTTRRQPAGHLTLTAEDRAPFEVSPTDRDDRPATAGPGDEVDEVAPLLAAAADRLARLDLDLLDDRQLDQLIAPVQRHLDRTTAARDRLIGARQRRAIAAAGPGNEQKALRATARQLTESLRLSPSETKQAGTAGRRLLDRPTLAAAIDDGRLRPAQARVIGEVLDKIGADQQASLTDELLDAARSQHPVELGNTARRRLAELDQDAAMADLRTRHAKRRATCSSDDHGMLHLHATVTGLDAETVATAIHAFRTADPATGPGRTSEQRTADAVVAVCRAALDGTTAPADHGVQPHLLVTVDLHDLASGTGTGEGRHTGPLPTRTLETFASQATIRVLGLDLNGLPIALSRATDHPTASQYLALAYRDGGCRHPGCDTPAAWCDIAHALARCDDGRIEPSNCLLPCRTHHRQIDTSGWTITIHPATAAATFTHPNGRVVAAHPPRGPTRTTSRRRDRPRPDVSTSTGTDPPDTS